MPMHPVSALWFWAQQYPEKWKRLCDARWLAGLASAAHQLPPSPELETARAEMVAGYPRLGENDFTKESMLMPTPEKSEAQQAEEQGIAATAHETTARLDALAKENEASWR